MRFLHLAWTCAVAASLCPASALHGQPGPATQPGADTNRIAVTIVLTQSGAPATVLRRTTEPRNVILVDSATIDSHRLSAAVFSFLVMERLDPEDHERSGASASRPMFQENAPRYPWAEATLRQLRTAPLRSVHGVGTHRAVQITVPPLRGHGRIVRYYHGPPSR